MSITVRGRFGFDLAIPFDRTTLAPLGVFQVIQEFNYEPTRDAVKLEGGNAPGAWAVEMGARENPLTVQMREFPEFALVEFEGAIKTVNAAEASGYFGNSGVPTNSKGTSVQDAATGIASVAADATNKANIPFGRLIFKGTATADEVDIYLVGKADSGFVADGAKVAEGITIAGTSGSTVVASLGIDITGGSGAISITDGDIAWIDVRGPNEGSTITEVGLSSEIREIGLMGVYPKRSDGSLVYVEFHRLMVVGPMPSRGIFREWADWTMNAEILVDICNNNRLYTLYNIEPDVTC